MNLRNKTAIVTGAAAVGRFGTAEEIAPTALYRVSPSAEFVTGGAVAMDGGLRI
jgi:NAD(P)-dependent dehydrogenase (short-subunit alcohol dehydrogenase family)